MFSSAKRLSVVAAVLAAGAQSVSAISISSNCEATLAGIVTSSQAKCINAQALVGLVTAGSNTSIVSPVNNWLTGLCSQAQCSNATLSDIVTNVSSGCSNELTSLGLPTTNSTELVAIVQEYYPAVRKIACLSDTANNHTLCVTETLTNIQSVTGTITTSNAGSIVSDIANGSTKLPANVTCTNCTKAAYDIVDSYHPELIDSDVNSTITGQCGASFANGAEPSSVTQSASTAIASTASSGALGVSSSVYGVALSALIVLCSAFALLA